MTPLLAISAACVLLNCILTSCSATRCYQCSGDECNMYQKNDYDVDFKGVPLAHSCGEKYCFSSSLNGTFKKGCMSDLEFARCVMQLFSDGCFSYTTENANKIDACMFSGENGIVGAVEKLEIKGGKMCICDTELCNGDYLKNAINCFQCRGKESICLASSSFVSCPQGYCQTLHYKHSGVSLVESDCVKSEFLGVCAKEYGLKKGSGMFYWENKFLIPQQIAKCVKLKYDLYVKEYLNWKDGSPPPIPTNELGEYVMVAGTHNTSHVNYQKFLWAHKNKPFIKTSVCNYNTCNKIFDF